MLRRDTVYRRRIGAGKWGMGCQTQKLHQLTHRLKIRAWLTKATPYFTKASSKSSMPQRRVFVITALPYVRCGSLLNAGCSPSQNSLKEGDAQ